jgi:FMN phosphatase YigB (HAD superfamily)
MFVLSLELSWLANGPGLFMEAKQRRCPGEAAGPSQRAVPSRRCIRSPLNRAGALGLDRPDSTAPWKRLSDNALNFTVRASASLAISGWDTNSNRSTDAKTNWQQRKAKRNHLVAAASIQPKALFFDIMGTLVRDPFFDDMYQHFGFATHGDFIVAKHPETWIRFERGEISVAELASVFFRPQEELAPALAQYAHFDTERFESYLRESYAFIDEEMESLLAWIASKRPRYSIHAFSNYPCYYKLIEEKLVLSRYLSWTAVSCETGMRKPDCEAYLEAARRADVPPAQCVLIDDQPRNIEGARKAGFGAAILFPGSSAALRSRLEEFFAGSEGSAWH